MAFLDGAPPERLCQPMVDHFTSRGGELRMDSRLKRIDLNEDGSVKALELVGGERVEADLYISAMPGGRPYGGGRGGGSGQGGAAGGARLGVVAGACRGEARRVCLFAPPVSPPAGPPCRLPLPPRQLT